MGKGRSGGGAASAETALSREQAVIVRELYEQTRGLRGGLIGAAERRLGLPLTQGETRDGVFFPMSEAGGALFGPGAPEREALELGFTGAREDILSRVPARGGQLNRILSDIEVDRARSIGALEAEATREATDIATGAAFEAPRLALGGLGAAAEGFGRAATRQSQSETAKGQGIGQVFGSILSAAGVSSAGNKIGRCWIALALYGDGMRFRLARSWIFDHWQGTGVKTIRQIYLLIGPAVAWIVTRSRLSRKFIKPFFDLALRKELELMRNG